MKFYMKYKWNMIDNLNTNAAIAYNIALYLENSEMEMVVYSKSRISVA